MSFTNEQVMNFAAYGLVGGTLFFSSVGIFTERDFFLLLGLIATAFGDVVLAAHLWDNSPVNNDEHATFFCCMAALSGFGIYAQFDKFREVSSNLFSHSLSMHALIDIPRRAHPTSHPQDGCTDDSDNHDDEEDDDNTTPAAPQLQATPRADPTLDSSASIAIRRRKKTG